MKLHKPEFRKIARKAGGLFLGLLFHFPASMSDPVEELEGTEFDEYTMVTLDVGLIFWRVTLHLSWGHRRRAPWMGS